MAPLLTASNIKAGYGDVVIVSDVTISVDSGEIIAIIGPNGSGKSTLLKSFFGFARLMGGTINYEGQDITNLASDSMVALGIGYVPQSDNVFTNLTIRENLEMGAYSRNDTRNIKADIKNVYQKFPELQRREKFFAGTLSGGERQMLAIARAMMANPKVLLLDEPLASLSPQAVGSILDKLTLIQESGTALIIIEQNVKRVLDFSKRAYVLVNGSCVLSGESTTVMANDDAKRRYLGFN